MKSSYRVFRIKGIDVSLHFSFLLLLPLLVLSFAGDMSEGIISIAYGFAVVMALFGSVLMHELSHSFMAIRNGVTVRSIILTPIGGIASIGLFKDAAKEFKITVAGPLSNFILGGVLLVILLNVYGPEAVANSVFSDDMFLVPSIMNFLVLLTYLNLVLGAFNLFLPIFPMDGGRVLRSMLNMLMNRLTATRLAVGIGQAFLSLFFVFSVMAGSLWLIAISIFLFFSGISELKFTEMSEAMEHTHLETFMSKEFIVIHPDLKVNEFLQLISGKQNLYPVLDESGKVKGVVLLENVKTSNKKIKDIMVKEFPSITMKDELSDIMAKIYGHQYAIVVDDKGILQGVLTLNEMQKAIKKGLKRI
jgi:Zn-dependent protease/predicted transcriptional regulator